MSHPTKADVKVLREVLKLVDLHRVDQLVIGSITVVKTRHGVEMAAPKRRSRAAGQTENQPPVLTNEAPESIEELDREARAILGVTTDG